MAEERNEDREIVVTRQFDAPRELVWDAWTQPQHVAQWWGPNGFTNTIREMSVQPGGVWRVMMHGPDGIDYPNKIVYHEVVRPERLVYDHSDDNEDNNTHFHVTVTFEEHGRGTRLTMRMLFPTAEERQRVVDEFGALDGASQTMERLREYLATMEVNHV
ncbi:MAG: SRPBCC family protein [Thermoanaerobaculia bacterium]